MENQELLTITEMAAKLKVPVSWLYSHSNVKRGDFPVIKVGKYCRYDAEAVMVWLKKKQSAIIVR